MNGYRLKLIKGYLLILFIMSLISFITYSIFLEYKISPLAQNLGNLPVNKTVEDLNKNLDSSNNLINKFNEIPVQTIVSKVDINLDELHRILLETGLTMIEVRNTSKIEAKAIPVLTSQLEQNLDSLNEVTKSTKNIIDGIEPIEQSAKTSIDNVNDTVSDFDEFLTNEDLKKIIANANTMTAAGASIGTDTSYQVHQWIHPTKKKMTFFGAMESTALWIHKFEPPIF